MTSTEATPDVPPPDDEQAYRDADGTISILGLLPALYIRYERLCRAIATAPIHDLAFFSSTFFFGPAGLYVWEARRGGLLRRMTLGLLAWLMLGVATLLLIAFGWPLAIVTLLLSRPLRWILRVTPLMKRRPAPEIPKKLTFEFETLDVIAVAFIAVIFFALVANRDDLMRIDMVSGSDPTYHMAVARQIVDHGNLPTWDRWEYAPFGRPHLYPPLLHVTIAFLGGAQGDVIFGFNTIQILLFPTALLIGWYFARWLFGPSVGLIALIVLSMDTAFMISQAMVLPSAVVTAIIPLILMMFLARRTKTAILLLTAALYTHGPVGVPEFVVLGLLVFCMRYRQYYPEFRKVIAFSFLAYLPWLIHVIEFRDWLGTASSAMGAKNAVEVVARGIGQLQHINVVLLVVALIGWKRDTDDRSGAVKSLLVGFLPMLLTYGGRYFMHTWPLWAILVGRVGQKWLDRARDAQPDQNGRRRPSLRWRIALLLTLSMIPLPVVRTGMGGPAGINVIPGVTGANAALAIAGVRSKPDIDFERLSEAIAMVLQTRDRRYPVTPPPADSGGEPKTYEAYLASPSYSLLCSHIVHIGTGDGRIQRQWGSLYFGDRIVAATGCRVDTGGWGPEVRSPLMEKEVVRLREEDPHCLFAFEKGEGFTPDEVEHLKSTHRLSWLRPYGRRYLLGGRGLAPPVDNRSGF